MPPILALWLGSKTWMIGELEGPLSRHLFSAFQSQKLYTCLPVIINQLLCLFTPSLSLCIVIGDTLKWWNITFYLLSKLFYVAFIEKPSNIPFGWFSFEILMYLFKTERRKVISVGSAKKKSRSFISYFRFSSVRSHNCIVQSIEWKKNFLIKYISTERESKVIYLFIYLYRFEEGDSGKHRII